MQSNKGLITKEDLASYKPEWRQPLVGKWNGAEVITMPPPSSGGIIVLMMLGMLKDDDLKKSGLNSAGTIHLMAESMKRCFADRAEYMADPGFAKVPIQRLLDPIYLASRRAEIDDRATSSTAIKPGLESHKEKEHTTHFSIVDAEGNAVSQTYTINDSYGSKVTSPKLGFIWNNEMDDFTAKPGSPNRYKILQGEVNSVQAGKRPLSSMTPTIVTKDGKLWMVLGSPGGPTIINTVLETILNVGVHGLTAQRAVGAPRFHHQWFPDQIRVEPGISLDTLNLLRAKGHEIDTSQSSQGSCHLILLDSNQSRTIGCDPRISTSGHAGY
jgi:gamma-glutamyltranspeptidase/glutathione hydrolase